MKQIVIILATLMGLSSVLIFQNCSKSKGASGINVTTSGQPTTNGKILSEVRYFSGGGFPGPNGPNFTDFTVTFYHAQLATLTKQGLDADCDLSQTLSAAQISQIVGLLNSIAYSPKPKSDNHRVDGGETFIEIKYQGSSELLKLYIDAAEAAEGVFEIVQGGDQLNDYLVGLYSNGTYAESCLSVNWDEVSVVRYFRGGWYGPAGQKNWSHDYVLNMSSGSLSSKVDDPLCGGSRIVSATELNAMKALISAEVISKKSVGEPIMADGVTETLQFTSADGVDRVFLTRSSAGVGNLVFEHSTNISNLMKSLVDNYQLAIACQ